MAFWLQVSVSSGRSCLGLGQEEEPSLGGGVTAGTGGGLPVRGVDLSPAVPGGRASQLVLTRQHTGIHRWTRGGTSGLVSITWGRGCMAGADTGHWGAGFCAATVWGPRHISTLSHLNFCTQDLVKGESLG